MCIVVGVITTRHLRTGSIQNTSVPPNSTGGRCGMVCQRVRFRIRERGVAQRGGGGGERQAPCPRSGIALGNRRRT